LNPVFAWYETIHDKYKRHNKLVLPRDIDKYIYASFVVLKMRQIMYVI